MEEEKRDGVPEIRRLIREAEDDFAGLKRAWSRARAAAKSAKQELEEADRERRQVLVDGSDDALAGLDGRLETLSREAEDLGEIERALYPRWRDLEAEAGIREARITYATLPALAERVETARAAARVAEEELERVLKGLRAAWNIAGVRHRRGDFPRLPVAMARRLEDLHRRSDHHILYFRDPEEDLVIPVEEAGRAAPDPATFGEGVIGDLSPEGLGAFSPPTGQGVR